jgi:hypothetical protein
MRWEGFERPGATGPAELFQEINHLNSDLLT